MDDSDEKSPWLTIDAKDYEAHMGHPSVGQLQALSGVLRAILERDRPSSLTVLGCATGNGFEHIDPSATTKVVGVDINPDYLTIANKRHEHLQGVVTWMLGDLGSVELPQRTFDHIHAGLIFEYVDASAILPKIATWLVRGGRFSVVLQHPSEKLGAVSTSPAAERLKVLGLILRHIAPSRFIQAAQASRLHWLNSERVELPDSKKLEVLEFVRKD